MSVSWFVFCRLLKRIAAQSRGLVVATLSGNETATAELDSQSAQGNRYAPAVAKINSILACNRRRHNGSRYRRGVRDDGRASVIIA
jgi:hypothetical protein